MKAFFITGSIVFTVLILIIAFENIASSCSNFMFVFLPTESSFLITILIAFIGVITGMFYSGLIGQLMKNPQEDEDAPGAW